MGPFCLPSLIELKAEIDKIDVTKLKTVPADLTMLSNVEDNDVVKKSVFHKLVIKINTNLSRINTISIKVPRTNQ